MSADLRIKLVATNLSEEEATRDAEWEEVWYVSSGYRFATVHLIVNGEIREKENSNPLKSPTVLFRVAGRDLTGFQVLEVAWLIGEGGPGMAEVGDESTVEPEWVRHASDTLNSFR